MVELNERTSLKNKCKIVGKQKYNHFKYHNNEIKHETHLFGFKEHI
jgi:hypothetical protein